MKLKVATWDVLVELYLFGSGVVLPFRKQLPCILTDSPW